MSDDGGYVFQRPKRGRIGQSWAMMGYIFQLIRQIDPNLKYTIDTFTLIGLLWSLKTTCSLIGSSVRGFRLYVWSRMWQLDLKKKYGEYVVITGPTDGIGLEYAKEFAKRGHGLILVARNQAKLDQVALDLSNLSSNSNIVKIVADLNDSTPELYHHIKEELKPYQNRIGILVNNAGVMFSSPKRYLEHGEEEVWQHVKVNITGVLMMTRAVLPGMMAKKRGLIINMSSIAGYQPLPLMGVYSASKKFVEYFSKTLEIEYGKSHNIEVQTLTPSYIATKMVKWSDTLQRPNLINPDAPSFAKSGIATIGRTNEATGYWSHELQLFLYQWFVPDWMYRFMSWHVLTGMDSTKKRT